jgi:hypothetical protein
MDVGLETNYIGSTSAEWNENTFQYYKNNTWNNWTTGSLSPTSGGGYGISRAWSPSTSRTSILTSKT